MKITLELPDPIFQQGDVLRWGAGDLIVHIYAVAFHGEWEHYNGETDAWSERGVYYHCAVQAGCTPEGTLLRPGTCTGFPEKGEPDHQLCDAEKIEWDKPILEPDKLENLAERQDAWAARA